MEVDYVNAGRLLKIVNTRFEEYDIPFIEDRNIIPEDDTTLFVCSGMQQVKGKFSTPDQSKYGSLQSCIRTNDLNLIGDGSHLTYFHMLGNFSFGNNDYPENCELWHLILSELELKIGPVHIHPTQLSHRKVWHQLGYQTIDDPECIWSDGNIGGYCCELYVGELEIGNLVNTMGHSVDVGFGLERLVQVLEGKSQVDQTSLFDQSLNHICRDLVRVLTHLYHEEIYPGDKGRNYIVRKICRLLIQEELPEGYVFDDWLLSEREIFKRRIFNSRRSWRRNKHRSPEWWWSTFGVDKEDVRRLKSKE